MGEHHYIVHHLLPGMEQHRCHRNRVMHWCHAESSHNTVGSILADGLGSMTSKWRDGLTGVFREPMEESSKHGPLGAVVGLGKGLTNLVASTVTGPVAAVRTSAHEA